MASYLHCTDSWALNTVSLVSPAQCANPFLKVRNGNGCKCMMIYLLVRLCQGSIMTHFLDRIALSVVHLFDPCTSGNTGEIGCLVSGAFFKLWPKDTLTTQHLCPWLTDRVLSLVWQGMWLAAWVLNLGTPAAPPSKGSSSLGSMNLTKTQTETNQELVWVSNPWNQTRWSSASSVLTLRMWPYYFLSQEVNKNILSTFLDCPCNPPESYGTMQARGPLASEMLR